MVICDNCQQEIYPERHHVTDVGEGHCIVKDDRGTITGFTHKRQAKVMYKK